MKLLEQQEKRLNDVLIKTEQVERISSEYVLLLAEKKSEVTTGEQRTLRKSSDSNIDNVPQSRLPYHTSHKVPPSSNCIVIVSAQVALEANSPETHHRLAHLVVQIRVLEVT